MSGDETQTIKSTDAKRLDSSSWPVRVQVSGEKLSQINYRNDPVKYDLNLIFYLNEPLFDSDCRMLCR